MFQTNFDSKNKEWNGLDVKSTNPLNVTLATAILNSLQMNESKIAQICATTNTAMTFADLYVLTARAATNLQRFHPKEGDVIAFITNDAFQTTPLVFAAMCLGLPVAPTFGFCSKSEYMLFLKQTNPAFVVCDSSLYDLIKKCLVNAEMDVEIFTVGQRIDEVCNVTDLFHPNDNDSSFCPVEIDQNKTAIILRTSGTTSLPKGACISHASLLDQMTRLSDIFESTDTLLGYVSIIGSSGVRLIFAGTLNGCTRIVNVGQFSPERFIDLVETYLVSVVQCNVISTTQLSTHPNIKEADLSSIKRYLCISSKAPYKAIKEMSKLLPNGKFINTYAMTETMGLVTANLDGAQNDSVGQLICGAKVKIVDDNGNRMDIGESGEICIKLKYPFSGYIGDEENSRAAFDDEGFYRTGDIGYFNENGQLFICDRTKDVFKSQGYPVSPSELEDFINRMEGVKQSCVVGVPDVETGYLVAAIVVKSSNSMCNEEQIIAAVAEEFAYYKHLHGGVYFVDSIPLTNASKIARKQITEYATKLHDMATANQKYIIN